MARIWRETGNASHLHGANAPVEGRRPTRSIDPAAEAAIDAAIDALGAQARFVDVRREVATRCGSQGLAAPGDSTVYDRLNRRRRTTPLVTGEPPTIAVVRCSPRIPVTHMGEIARPVALLAIALPEEVVLAAEIGVDGRREPDLGRLVRRLARLSRQDAPPRSIVAQQAVLDGAGAVAIEGVTLTRSPGAASIVSRVFGQRLGQLRITGVARSDRAFAQRAAARLNAAPPLVEATSLLLRAIEVHNAARSAIGLPAFSLAGPAGA